MTHQLSMRAWQTYQLYRITKWAVLCKYLHQQFLKATHHEIRSVYSYTRFQTFSALSGFCNRKCHDLLFLLNVYRTRDSKVPEKDFYPIRLSVPTDRPVF